MVLLVLSAQVSLTRTEIFWTSIGDEPTLFLIKLFIAIRDDVRVIRVCLEVQVAVALWPDRSDLPHPTDHLGQVGEPGVAGAHTAAGPLVADVEVLQAPPPVLDLLQEPQLARLPQPCEVSLAVVITNFSDLVK